MGQGLSQNEENPITTRAITEGVSPQTTTIAGCARASMEAGRRRWVLVGRQFGPYRILSPLGAGGMGEVYRAHDTRLGRDVAIKTLPSGLSSDPERLARFRREARTLASLNHPNIATIHGFEQFGDVDCLIMELVEGEAPVGPLTVSGALDCARQVAGALEAAHAKGIVHRDLKPSNVRVTPQGVVKVVDFGLAKPLSGSEPEPCHPGVVDRGPLASMDGGVMGTPGYMSPEQAGGKDVDTRTDVWAFGCLLFELLSGRRAFPLAPAAEPRAALALGDHPNWRALPADTPPKIRELLRRCLQTNSDLRLRSIADARRTIEESTRVRSRWRFAALAAIAAAALAAAPLAYRAYRAPDNAVAPPRVLPFATLPGGKYEPQFSPDGKYVAFVWDGEKQDNFDIYTQAVAGGAPRRITFDKWGEGSPSWSPDGRSIAFIRTSEQPGISGVFIVPATGGAETKIASLSPLAHIYDRHLDWSPDGRFLAFVDREGPTAPFHIYLYSFAQQAKRQLTFPPAESAGDTGPLFSPDSKTVAFRRSSSSGVNDIHLVPAAGGAPRRVTFDNAFISGHAWLPNGREIVFSSRRMGSRGLWRLTLRNGSLRPVGLGAGAYYLAISRQGDQLAYSEWVADTNIWRAGIGPGREKARPVIASTVDDTSPQYSPDDRKIAFRSNRSGSDEIWECDAGGDNPVRLTSFGGPLTGTPRWSPDGTRIAFDSRPGGRSQIFVVSAAGGPVRQVSGGGADNALPSWSADGRWIYFASNRGGQWQVWKLPSDAERGVTGAVQITQGGGFAAFESPDGKWLYYAKGRDLSGLWRVRPDGGEESAVIPDPTVGYWGDWAVAPAGLYFVQPAAGSSGAVKFYSFASRKSRQVAVLSKMPPNGDSGFAVAHDGSSILYTQTDHADSNIMRVENFR